MDVWLFGVRGQRVRWVIWSVSRENGESYTSSGEFYDAVVDGRMKV